MNNILSHEQTKIDEIVTKNRYGIRKLEATYLQNQYQKMQQMKNAEKAMQRMEKEKDLQMLNKLNDTYLNDVSSNRRKKVQQMQSLSNDYNDFIKNNQQKHRIDKLIDKNIQRSTLVAPTWVRDVFTERQTYKKNMQCYNKSLDDHVKLQQMRKQMQKEEQNYMKKKIDKQADQLMKKQYGYLEARHRQKSDFQKRQNQLLGIRSANPNDISSLGLHDKQTVFKRKQQDLYSQGLSIQFRKEQEKKLSSQKSPSNTSNIYNPITNPIPFIYKNPNVLRMMSQG